MYDKCYFCLDQLPKLKKESTASFFIKFWRSRGTKEPAYITVLWDISCEYFVYSVDGFRRLRLVPLAVNQRRLIRPSRTQNLPSPAQNLASRAQNLQALPRQIWKLVSAALFTPRCWQISLCWRWCDLTYVCQRSWFFERRRISEPSAEAGRGVAWNDKCF